MLFARITMPVVLALSFLASVPPVWTAAASGTKFPILPRMANQSTLRDSPANDDKKYIADALCTPHQKLTEKVSWREALLYAQALASWQPNSTFQPAIDLYMGNDSRGQLSTPLQGTADEARQDPISPKYAPLIVNFKANIEGAVNLHDLSTWPENQKLFVFCVEPPIPKLQAVGCSLGMVAYE